MTCTIVATASGKEVARAITVVPLAGATGRPADLTVAIASPAFAGDRVVRQLPDTFSEVCTGGGGKYLLFGLPKQG